MLKRALLFCRNEDEETKYRVVREVCRMFSENFSPDMTTTRMADMRKRVVEKITKDPDPMKDLKDESIREGELIYPKLTAYVEKIADARHRFAAALKIALAGNIVEFGAQDHKVNLKMLEKEIFDVVCGPLAIDDSDKIFEKVKKSKEVLYVTDNAGELIFDRILIKEILKYAKVNLAPLSRPAQDDASVAEAKKAGMDRLCPMIPRGDSIGVWFERCEKEFLKKWDEADFIIAKGMGCYETLVDYPEKTGGKVGLLMKAKCDAVARDVKVPLGGAIVKII